jgi:hypothetical protein
MKNWRIWGLTINFAGNALALYGLAGLLRDGSRLPYFLAGAAVTVVCILVLAKPSPD